MLQSHLPFVPAEWSPQARMWTCWPSHPALWPGDLLERARGEIAKLIGVLAEHTPCVVLACGREAMQSAHDALGANATVIMADFGDIWLRDTGPVFVDDKTCLRFSTNGWGGKYLYEFDDSVGDTVVREAGAALRRFSFILEGGALEHNGEGLILTTRQCLLNPNRNDWNESEAEAALNQAFNASRVAWLDAGLDHDHTDGHVDNLARFINHKTVVCQHASGDDDPNARLYEKTAADLRDLGFEVAQVPSPGLIRDDEGAITPASHMNFIISNGAVVVPVYGSVNGDSAVAALGELFPRHRVVGVRANALLTGGGSFHCITQQQPAPQEKSSRGS